MKEIFLKTFLYFSHNPMGFHKKMDKIFKKMRSFIILLWPNKRFVGVKYGSGDLWDSTIELCSKHIPGLKKIFYFVS